MAKIYLVSATERKLSRALELLDREVVAYNTREQWIEVRLAFAEDALELLKASRIDGEIRPPLENQAQQMLDQIWTDARSILRELDPSKAPSFASVVLTRITAIERRLKALEKKLRRPG